MASRVIFEDEMNSTSTTDAKIEAELQQYLNGLHLSMIQYNKCTKLRAALPLPITHISAASIVIFEAGVGDTSVPNF